MRFSTVLSKSLPVKLALALTCFALGCGSTDGGAVVVTGKISYKGQPLNTGTVIFTGSGNKGGSSPIGSDGSFSVSDIAIGENIVVVRIPKPGPKPPPCVPLAGPEIANPVQIPINYSDAGKSGLKFTITPGKQAINIDLK